MDTMDQLTRERYTELWHALYVIIQSPEIAEELENANYHSVIPFFREIMDTMCVHKLGPKYEQYGEVVQHCVNCDKEIYLGETWE